MKPLRILLVDDSPLFLASAASVLATFDAMEIVGQTASAAEAFAILGGAAPDLVLMDLSMPHMNGIEATTRLKALPHPPRVVLVSLHEGEEFRAAALAAGADGFVVKAHFVEAMSSLIAEEKKKGRRPAIAAKI